MQNTFRDIAFSTTKIRVYHTYKNYIQKLLLRELLIFEDLSFLCTLIKNKGRVLLKTNCETVNALKLKILSTPKFYVYKILKNNISVTFYRNYYIPGF